MALRIGFVGTGWMAGQHMNALEKMAEAQVTACADVDPDRAARAAARFAGCGAYSDWHDMLKAQELDAAYVCVPPHAHGEVELALIKRGIPFFVEKPVANDMQTPRRVLKALEKRGLIASVGYMMRYRENADRLKAELPGVRPILVRGRYLCEMPQTPWWRRKGQSGGQLVEQTTHIVDLVRYLFGEVASVYCVGRTGLITDVDGYDTEDASACTLRFEDGTLCEIASTCAVQHRSGDGFTSFVGLEVCGTSKQARLDGSELNLTLCDGRHTEHLRSADDPVLAEDKAFVEAVLSGDPSGIRSPYADAIRTQAVTCAANESMSTGQAVEP